MFLLNADCLDNRDDIPPGPTSLTGNDWICVILLAFHYPIGH
jgi:hypothetical protein